MTVIWPSTSSSQAGLLALLASSLGVWATSPLLWPFGPLGWLCAVWALASTESGYDGSARGDDGGSVGWFQVRAATQSLVGLPSADPTSPADAAALAGAIVVHAIRSDPTWALVYLPVVRWPLLRALWTHGEASGSLGNGLATVAAGQGGELRGVEAYAVLRGVTLPLVLLPLLVVLRG